MKTKRTFLFSLLLTWVMVPRALAADVTIDQARVVAQRFASAASRFSLSASQPLALAHTAMSRDGHPDYYVFNRGSDDGFVVISGDDRLQAVCAYSETGHFMPDELPCNVKAWFEDYQRQVQYLRSHADASPRLAQRLAASVSPLLTTRWHQCRPFNDLCPEAASQDDPYWIYGNHACTGCVATSTAQLMNYYEWPKRGTGSFSYYTQVTFYDPNQGHHDVRGETLSANFGETVYEWDKMRDQYLYKDKNGRGYIDEQGHVYIKIIDDNGDTIPDPDGMYSAAVARLMSDVGIAVKMSYGDEASSAETEDQMNALEQYFGYETEYRWREEYQGDWEALLRSDLAAGHPLIICGYGYSGGHAFIIDGYDSQGLFHVNWGWGGRYDGYFQNTVLNPGGMDFSIYQECVLALPVGDDVLRGDVDGDGNVAISDVTALIDYLLGGDSAGVNLDGADVDGDGNVAISDVTALIDYLLGGSWDS